VPAHRDPMNRPITWLSTDAELGALGLDFANIPPDVAGTADALAEWRRLADEYQRSPVRFREADRSAVIAYCISLALFLSASRQLLPDALLVEGRSSADRGRQVKNPMFVMWMQASGQLRYWARELGLTCDARARQGLVNDGKPDEDDDDLLGRTLSR
jgi:P27 family predicted phage terminase small subunit